ncbi:MAG: carboxypeptidase-like regulatory domain-containing protein [Muribaculaceae bacterium]|nr:carboxypeptidase-like regulatory domain-containing protein [Muribaculaceae bacterium]
MEGLPYASVIAEGVHKAVVADEKGLFEMKVPADVRTLKATSVGYESRTLPLRPEGLNLYDFQLPPSTTELRELVVKKKKYSKKNNPAVDFARRLRETADASNPALKPNYNYNEYERITIALNNFNPEEKAATLRRFPFLTNYVDTSEVSGKTVLPVSVTEKIKDVFQRGEPDRQRRERVSGVKREGVDEMIGQENMVVMLEDILGEVDFYQNDINLLQNRFVSPLSRIAPDFYKFYLVDTVQVNDEKCVVLSFYPHNKASFGFSGSVYVALNDSNMFVRKAEMRIPQGINLNFIESLMITQTYDRGPDGTRLKRIDDLVIEAKPVPGGPGIYLRRVLNFRDHNFEAVPDSVFDGLGEKYSDPEAAARDSIWWDEQRKVSVGRGERSVALLVRQLRSNKVYYWTEKCIKILFTGYVGTKREGTGPSKFDIGPVNTFISYNSLEGLRLRAGGLTTAALSKRWFGRGFVAYGIRDHRWKYSIEGEYSFHDKLQHSREFPVHSLKILHSYDTDSPGEHYLFTNQDNFVLSFRRMSDDLTTYMRKTRLEYTLELRNNFSVLAALETRRQEASRTFRFELADGTPIDHFTENLINVRLRYAPGEKFYQGRTHRIPINLDAPVIVLEHTFAPKGFAGSRWGVNKTELNVSKRFWLSAFGFIDCYAGGGYVWGETDFLDLCIPNANLSYTIQPQSFALMSPLEFVNSRYVSWDLTYWLNGALLNLIPGIKKAKLREVVGFRGLYGSRSERCTPSSERPWLLAFPSSAPARPMDEGPYMELSAGIDNLFKILRVDYVRRLNYRHVGYPIDRDGVRIALHVTF